MKVVTNEIILYGERFILVREPKWGANNQYGTIPYSEIGENGKLKRELNGIQMCVANSVYNAVECRKDQILANRWTEAHPDATHEEQLKAVADIVMRRVAER